MKLPLLLTCLTVLAFATPSFAQQRDLLDGFRRGINLSHWYAQTMVGHYDESHLSTYFTEADAQKVADMGFDHVRLTLNQTVLFDADNPGTLNAGRLELMRPRVRWFLDRDVNVIIDLHPDDHYKEALLQAEHADAFVKDWRALAEAFADMPVEHLAFEIMNEPKPQWEVGPWSELQGRALAAIREVAPDHTVVVNAGDWTGVDSLPKMTPYDDPNVLYTFHFYGPFFYTHQSASWAPKPVEGMADVPWLMDPDTPDEVIRGMVSSDEGFEWLRGAVTRGDFTIERMRGDFDDLAAWAEQHDVPVYLGEFGVYTKAGKREHRLAWLEFVRTEAESRGWGWAMWDYAGGFRVVEGEDRTPDEELLEALGL
ncbi:MAG: glycoside hydrolase family 5 protein [Planctomycetota bacterium]